MGVEEHGCLVKGRKLPLPLPLLLFVLLFMLTIVSHFSQFSPVLWVWKKKKRKRKEGDLNCPFFLPFLGNSPVTQPVAHVVGEIPSPLPLFLASDWSKNYP